MKKLNLKALIKENVKVVVAGALVAILAISGGTYGVVKYVNSNKAATQEKVDNNKIEQTFTSDNTVSKEEAKAVNDAVKKQAEEAAVKVAEEIKVEEQKVAEEAKTQALKEGKTEAEANEAATKAVAQVEEKHKAEQVAATAPTVGQAQQASQPASDSTPASQPAQEVSQPVSEPAPAPTPAPQPAPAPAPAPQPAPAPAQNYDEVTSLGYSTHTGFLNQTSNPGDKEIGASLSRVTLNSSRNDLIERTCNQIANGRVSASVANGFWAGKYFGNAYQAKSVRMITTRIPAKKFDESDSAYLARVRKCSVFGASPSTSTYFDKVYQFGDLNDRSVAIITRVIFDAQAR